MTYKAITSDDIEES